MKDYPLPKEKAYLEPRHAVQRTCCWDEERGAVEDMHAQGPKGDAHDQFINGLGGDVMPRGGHQDSVKAHLSKIDCGVVDDRKHVYGDKNIAVPVKPEPEPPDGIGCCM
jgi:hypothetical protein